MHELDVRHGEGVARGRTGHVIVKVVLGCMGKTKPKQVTSEAGSLESTACATPVPWATCSATAASPRVLTVPRFTNSASGALSGLQSPAVDGTDTRVLSYKPPTVGAPPRGKRFTTKPMPDTASTVQWADREAQARPAADEAKDDLGDNSTHRACRKQT